MDGSFSVDDKYFYNLPSDVKKKILDYPLFVYVCDGTDSERLDWFRIINIAGEQLTDQELWNAVYAGPWTSDAKRYFSKSGIYEYLLTGEEKKLSLRAFNRRDALAAYEEQKHKCAICGENSSSTRCTPTTSHHGAKEVQPSRKIAKCSAVIAT